MSYADGEYFELRAAEESRIADTSADPVAAGIHRRLSILYSNRAKTNAGEPLLVPMPVAGRLPA